MISNAEELYPENEFVRNKIILLVQEKVLVDFTIY